MVKPTLLSLVNKVTKVTTDVAVAIKVGVIAQTPTAKVITGLKLSAAIVVNSFIIVLNASNQCSSE
jgi:hypothetical protein